MYKDFHGIFTGWFLSTEGTCSDSFHHFNDQWCGLYKMFVPSHFTTMCFQDSLDCSLWNILVYFVLHYVHVIKKPHCFGGSLYFENSWQPGRGTGIIDRISESIEVTSVKICSQIVEWVLICPFPISKNSATSWLFTLRLLYWASVTYL